MKIEFNVLIMFLAMVVGVIFFSEQGWAAAPSTVVDPRSGRQWLYWPPSSGKKPLLQDASQAVP